MCNTYLFDFYAQIMITCSKYGDSASDTKFRFRFRYVLLSDTNTHFNLLFHVYMRSSHSLYFTRYDCNDKQKSSLIECTRICLLLVASSPLHVYRAYLWIYAYFITHFKWLDTISSKTKHTRLPLKMAIFFEPNATNFYAHPICDPMDVCRSNEITVCSDSD